MKPTITLITKIDKLNEFYNEAIKKFSKTNGTTFLQMKEIIEKTAYGVMPENESLKKEIRDLVKEYELLMMSLANELNINGIGVEEISILSGYIAVLNPTQMKKLSAKEILDIVLFVKIIIEMQINLEAVSKEDQEFFHNFNLSIFKDPKED